MKEKKQKSSELEEKNSESGLLEEEGLKEKHHNDTKDKEKATPVTVLSKSLTDSSSDESDEERKSKPAEKSSHPIEPQIIVEVKHEDSDVEDYSIIKKKSKSISSESSSSSSSSLEDSDSDSQLSDLLPSEKAKEPVQVKTTVQGKEISTENQKNGNEQNVLHQEKFKSLELEKTSFEKPKASTLLWSENEVEQQKTAPNVHSPSQNVNVITPFVESKDGNEGSGLKRSDSVVSSASTVSSLSSISTSSSSDSNVETSEKNDIRNEKSTQEQDNVVVLKAQNETSIDQAKLSKGQFIPNPHAGHDDYFGLAKSNTDQDKSFVKSSTSQDITPVKELKFATEEPFKKEKEQHLLLNKRHSVSSVSSLASSSSSGSSGSSSSSSEGSFTLKSEGHGEEALGKDNKGNNQSMIKEMDMKGSQDLPELMEAKGFDDEQPHSPKPTNVSILPSGDIQSEYISTEHKDIHMSPKLHKGMDEPEKRSEMPQPDSVPLIHPPHPPIAPVSMASRLDLDDFNENLSKSESEKGLSSDSESDSSSTSSRSKSSSKSSRSGSLSSNKSESKENNQMILKKEHTETFNMNEQKEATKEETKASISAPNFEINFVKHSPEHVEGSIVEELKKGHHIVDIKNIKLTKAQVEEAADFLQKKTGMSQLSLVNCGLTDEDIETIVESLIASPAKPMVLNLSGNQLTSECVSHLLELLLKKPSIEAMLLSDLNLGDIGVTKLVLGLQDQHNVALFNDNKTENDGTYQELHELHISNCNFGDDGMESVILLIKSGMLIDTLNLSMNKAITKKGWKDFATALSKAKTIETLTLDNNNLGDECIEELAKSLSQNTSLTALDLNNVNITEKGGRYLIDLLKRNTYLLEINLQGNNLSDELVEEINKYIALNKSLHND